MFEQSDIDMIPTLDRPRGNRLRPRFQLAGNAVPLGEPLAITFRPEPDGEVVVVEASPTLAETVFASLPASVLEGGAVAFASLADDLSPGPRARLILAVWRELARWGQRRVPALLANGVTIRTCIHNRCCAGAGEVSFTEADLDLRFAATCRPPSVFDEVVKLKLR